MIHEWGYVLRGGVLVPWSPSATGEARAAADELSELTRDRLLGDGWDEDFELWEVEMEGFGSTP